ncbi:hypothetical protein D0Z00_004437 [Geotrichum galactomycetum]|uniref:Uncharacterized protein n=1 Tax=Geotrichum galactomycetum TaxID=27317 RepID=A0ACB6UYH3_9ASCO|nr:hypothetical protein D0Z00_004437 [Geotrichum candidum]
MADRYEIDIKYGVLVYSETGETVRVPGFASEVRDLLIHRNSIARNQAKRDVLPELIDNTHMCRKCERLAACMTFKCVDENASINSEQVAAMDDPGILTEYLEKVGHVKQNHIEFFKHWNGLLVKEEMEMSSHLKEIWTLTSSAREKIGRSFAGLRVQGPPQEVQVSDVVTRYTYVLERSDPAAGPFTLANSEISPGDPIVVSDENGHVHLASGLFVSGTRNAVTITVNRRLTDSLQKRKGFDEEYNQVFNSRLNARIRASQRGPSGDDEIENVPTTLFRVDKDEFRQALSVARNNLVELLLQKEDHSNLRSIADLAPPRFSEWSALPQSAAQKLAHFNPDQFEAIKKVLVAQDYALVLGMPGTGKTTTIAALIEMLVARGQTVLLASYTHSAVDTILRKIKDSGFGILRLGRPSLVNPDVRHLAIGPGGSGAARPQTIADIEQLYFKPPVVAATCLGTTHWLFKRRRFDYCIVDEASQVTLPTCLGPIRHADRFVLVGDHFQLSPLVKSTEAQAGGLDVSLFKRLNDSHPEAVVHLEHQYRMCEDIMAVSNKLIYGGRLKSFETSDGERTQNPREADVVQLVVEALCQSGVAEAAVGVLSVYRAQLRLLTARLRARPGVEVLTADRSQGRDKDCIVISLVRSNAHAAVGDLLRDWRRLNVSFTRAKSKLVIVGSRTTLEKVGVLRAFLDLVDDHGWAYELPSGAEGVYRGLAPAAESPVRPARVAPQGRNKGLQLSSSSLNGAKGPVAHRVGALPRAATRKLGVVHDVFAELQNQQPQQQR